MLALQQRQIQAAGLVEADQSRNFSQRIATAQERSHQALFAHDEERGGGQDDVVADRRRAHADDGAVVARGQESAADQIAAPGTLERVVDPDAEDQQ